MAKLMVIVPALNEQGAIGDVVRSVRQAAPGIPVLVIDDHSSDGTGREAGSAGAEVLRLPVHSGLGGCLRIGYRIALERGCDYVIRVDGDGQHEAADIPRILATLVSTGADIVIGSRFVSPGTWRSPLLRAIGIGLFRRLLGSVLRTTVHDPTSGFVGVNRRALEVFARAIPHVCPEIGGLILLRRQHLFIQEISCRMHPRRTGRSSFNFATSFRYALHALRGILIEHAGGHGFGGD